MKKLIIFSLLSVLLFSPSLSLAGTYPDTCDETAQAIIDGIGGCSEIDCGMFPNICDKCCSVEAEVDIGEGAEIESDSVESKTFLQKLLNLPNTIFLFLKSLFTS